MAVTQEIVTDVRHVPRSRLLRDLALLYGRIGTTAFGSPAAHVAMMWRP